MQCPNCHSEAVSFQGYNRIGSFGSDGALYLCRVCRHPFYELESHERPEAAVVAEDVKRKLLPVLGLAVEALAQFAQGTEEQRDKE